MLDDTCIFKNRFPTPYQYCTTIYDAWKSASRQCNVKGAIRDIYGNLDQTVSGTFAHIQILYLEIMQLRKTRNNMKSRLVAQVEANIRQLYELENVGSPSEINKRIDFLLEHNRYFCKYQEVYFLPL